MSASEIDPFKGLSLATCIRHHPSKRSAEEQFDLLCEVVQLLLEAAPQHTQQRVLDLLNGD